TSLNDETTASLGGTDYAIRFNPQAIYTWLATSGSASWTDPYSWSPARLSPQPNDVLLFNQGGSSTASNIPAAETVTRIHIYDNTQVNFSTTAPGILSINGPTMQDNLIIENGSGLTLSASLTFNFV